MTDRDNDPFLSHQRQIPRAQGSLAPGPGLYKNTAGKTWNSWFCFSIFTPIPLFLIISIGFAFLWKVMSFIPVAFVILGLLRTITVGARGNDISDSQTKSGLWLQSLACLLAVVLGTATGIFAYEHFMRTFYNLAYGREYQNVVASSPAAAYADAGKLYFADTSTVDLSKALGYKREHTYCVAPIIDSGPEQVRTIGFFAIGLDCCGSRGEFECGGAGEDQARGGVRAPVDGVFEFSHSAFMDAVMQAAAVYDIEPEEEPLLVHWVKDPNREQRNAILATLGTVILGTGLFVIMVIILSVMASLSMSQGQLPQ